MEKQRLLEIMNYFMDFMAEELDPFEHPNEKDWFCKIFNIDEEEYDYIRGN